MKNSSNILLGILGAAAAGVVIGMIIAPKKGSAFRSDIKSSSRDLTKKLGEMLSRGKDKYDELRSIATEERNNLKRSAKEFASEASGAYDKAEEAYNEFSAEASKAYKKAKA